jgi:hypothetical protein
MTAPEAGPGAGAGTAVAVGGGPAAGVTGGGPASAPVVDASCDGGGNETGGGSSGAPPPLPPSPAFRPREKSFGSALGAAVVGGVARPPVGLPKPGPRDGADVVPPDIPVDGIPVDGKFSPPDDPPDIGIDGVLVDAGVLGAGGLRGDSCGGDPSSGRSTIDSLPVFALWWAGASFFGSSAGGRVASSGLSRGGEAGADPLSSSGRSPAGASGNWPISPVGIPPRGLPPPPRPRKSAGFISGSASPFNAGEVLFGVPILATRTAISAAMLALSASAAARAAETTAAIALTRALNLREAPMPPP